MRHEMRKPVTPLHPDPLIGAAIREIKASLRGDDCLGWSDYRFGADLAERRFFDLYESRSDMALSCLDRWEANLTRIAELFETGSTQVSPEWFYESWYRYRIVRARTENLARRFPALERSLESSLPRDRREVIDAEVDERLFPASRLRE
jgi:hypothetical protein